MKPSLNERLHGTVYLTLQNLRRRPVGRFMRVLAETERLDRASYQRVAEQRLVETLRYARAHVPLYSSDRWRAALARGNPDRVQTWPVLERDVVRAQSAQLMSTRRFLTLNYRTSSASTGTPLRVAMDPHAAAWCWANEYRALLWEGIPLGARIMSLWGNTRRVDDLVRNRTVFLTTGLTPERLEEAARYLIEQRPSLLMGYPSAVTQLAQYVAAAYPNLPQPMVRFARFGGEQSYPFQREEIRRHLGARLVETYGCTEVGAIAHRCQLGSLHIFAENVHVEIFREGAPVGAGEFGDIVATSLTNRAMPLVRCRIGDRGALSPDPCACGLPHPILGELQARDADMLLATDGTRVHGSRLGPALQAFFASAPAGVIHLVQFQQLDQWHWKVLVESRAGFSDEVAARLAEVVRSVYGGADVRVERVRTIPREKSGKFRYYFGTPNVAATAVPSEAAPAAVFA